MNLPRIDRIEIEATARKYISGRMSENEEAQFETRMLEDPRIAEEVEITRRMRDGLQQLQRTATLDLDTSTRLAWLPASRVSLTAAGIVTILAVAALYYVRPAPPSTVLAASADALPDFGAAPAPESYPLQTDRRAGDDSLVIQMPNPRGVIRLNLLPPRPVAGRLRVELRRTADPADSEPLARIEAGPADQRLVAVFLNTSELAAGGYELTLIELEPAERSPATTRYRFMLRSER